MPDPLGEAFDPETFLTDNGTLYLLATGAGAGASAALVAALIEDLIETARRLAARSPGTRLDPPLLLALDEIGTLAPLPSLLPFGIGAILMRTARPIIAELRPWTRRPDAKTLQSQRAEIEAILRSGAGMGADAHLS